MNYEVARVESPVLLIFIAIEPTPYKNMSRLTAEPSYHPTCLKKTIISPVGHNGAECKSLVLPARWLLSPEKVGEHTCASLYTDPTFANCTTSVNKKSGM